MIPEVSVTVAIVVPFTFMVTVFPSTWHQITSLVAGVMVLK